MPLLDLNGTTLHVLRLGESGGPVVMLHGLLLGNVATWYFTAAPDLARTHRVLLYDLRGHGRSARPDTGYDLTTMTADLDALLADEPGPIDLVGHSWGALVALRWALDHPERVHRLALVEAPLPPSAPAEIRTFVEQDPAAMLDALPDGLKAAVAGGKRQARKLLEHLVDHATRTSLLPDLTSTPAFDDAALAALHVPTLLIYGASSSCRPSGVHLATVLPDARLVTLPGGHYLPLEHPTGVLAALSEHLHG